MEQKKFLDQAGLQHFAEALNEYPNNTVLTAVINAIETEMNELQMQASYTPQGTVTTPVVTVSSQSTTVNSIVEVGSLPSLDYSVENEILSFSFDQGMLPTKGQDTTVVTSVDENANVTSIQFNGTTTTISGQSSDIPPANGVSF